MESIPSQIRDEVKIVGIDDGQVLEPIFSGRHQFPLISMEKQLNQMIP